MCEWLQLFLPNTDSLTLLPITTNASTHIEQYIIKPPQAHNACITSSSSSLAATTFNWHYDSQYASSSTTGGTASSTTTGCGGGSDNPQRVAAAGSSQLQQQQQQGTYLSLWVALDDMTAENGCLVMLPRAPATRGQLRCCHKCSQGEKLCIKCLTMLCQQAAVTVESSSLDRPGFVVCTLELCRVIQPPAAATAAAVCPHTPESQSLHCAVVAATFMPPCVVTLLFVQAGPAPAAYPQCTSMQQAAQTACNN